MLSSHKASLLLEIVGSLVFLDTRKRVSKTKILLIRELLEKILFFSPSNEVFGEEVKEKGKKCKEPP
jgi:hypothetical protein